MAATNSTTYLSLNLPKRNRSNLVFGKGKGLKTTVLEGAEDNEVK